MRSLSARLQIRISVFFILLFGASSLSQAGKHPVPLEPKADAATCLQCHNSDDNRESGGTGPNGPHGSTFTHILERRYEMSQAPSPGAMITNPLPNPDFTATGPYALCDKCHDLSSVISASSAFTRHVSHVKTDGFSCSVCHTAHGMGGTNANISGERLVDFDINVVAPMGQTPISFNRSARTCTLTCHGVAHSASAY